MGEYNCLMLFCLTAVDTEMLFEVVFVFERFPTLQTFELPGLQALIHHDGALGRQGIVLTDLILEKFVTVALFIVDTKLQINNLVRLNKN